MWNRYVIRRKINSLARRTRCTWAPARPLNAWVVVTNRCNVQCRICPIHGPERHLDPEQMVDMKPEVYERVRRELMPGLQWVYAAGLGEPFIAPIFYRLLEDFLPAGKRLFVVTNGTIISKEAIARLVRSPSSITLSLDGTTPAVLEYIRNGVKFDRVIAFLEAVKAARERHGHAGFHLGIGYVVTRTNLGQMRDAVELAHRFGVNTVSFSNFSVPGRKDAFRHESLTNAPDLVLPRWTEASRRAAELGIAVPSIYFECEGQSEPDRKRHQPTKYDGNRLKSCPMPWWNVYVDVDGTVRPCCAYPASTSMGNILRQPIRRIWNGPGFRELRRTVNTPHMPDPCRRCFLPCRI